METARVLLRKYKISDAKDMFRNWVTDQEASRFWGWKPHENIAETKGLLKKWIAAYENPDTYHWVIVLKNTREAIGYIYLSDINSGAQSASVHYLLSRRFWNQGLATEACRTVLGFSFTKIGLARVHTCHHTLNPASGRVLQKAGMRYTETKFCPFPGCKQLSGDYHYYQITKSQWEGSA